MSSWNPAAPAQGPQQQGQPRLGGARGGGAVAAAAPGPAPVVAPPVPVIAPGNLVPTADLANYQFMNGYYWYTQRLDIRDEGWKLHVSGNLGNTALIYTLALPVLRANNVAHKFLLTTAEVAGNDADQQQAGKILAVYPNDIAEAFTDVGLIDAALQGQLHRAGSPQIANEIAVGNTVVYTRYGPYAGSIYDPQRQKYVNDPIGQTHPAWIQNPWPNYPNQAALAALPPWPTHAQAGHRRRGR